ncbi:MAG: tyrosine-type recombinase/integrase [Opitutaceae bacterium]
MPTSAELATLIEAFFTQRLMARRGASPHTIASDRDTFRLLFQCAEKRLGRPPATLALNDPDAPFLSEFLADLESVRGNQARSRNLRLTAIRSFFRYAALAAPSTRRSSTGGSPCRVNAPRAGRSSFLARSEIEALLSAVDAASWGGRRDHALLLTAMQTGLRRSELTALRPQDVALGLGAHVRCLGKGRKASDTPLTKSTAKILGVWRQEPGRNETKFLFPSRSGGQLSPDAVQALVRKHVVAAQKRCPSFARKRVSPRTWPAHLEGCDLLCAWRCSPPWNEQEDPDDDEHFGIQ